MTEIIRYVWVREERRLYIRTHESGRREFLPVAGSFTAENARLFTDDTRTQLVEWPAGSVMSGPSRGMELLASFTVWYEGRPGAAPAAPQTDDVTPVRNTSSIERLDWSEIHVLYGSGLWVFSRAGDVMFRLPSYQGESHTELLRLPPNMIPTLVSYDPSQPVAIKWHRWSAAIVSTGSTLLDRLQRCCPCLEHRDSMPCIMGVYGHEGAHMTEAGDRWRVDVSTIPALLPPSTIVEMLQEKSEPLTCSFCDRTEGVVRFEFDGVVGCLKHFSTARLHVTRLKSGGLMHCPETAAETARFERAAAAADWRLYEEASGYRTQIDQKAPPTRPSPEPDPIPLVGTTPHYEWP